MKKLFIILNIFVIAAVTSCQNFNIKDDEFPFPSKNKPELVLKEYPEIEGEKLSFVEQIDYVENKDLSSIKQGLIQTYDEYLNSKITQKLEEEFFEDHFVFIYGNVYSDKKTEYVYHDAVINENNTFAMRLEVEKYHIAKQWDRDKSFIWLFIFEKGDYEFSKGYHLYQLSPIYHDPATYLTLFFDPIVYENPALIDQFLNKYKILSKFYVEPDLNSLMSAVNTQKMIFRVSNQAVLLDEVRVLIDEVLNDELVLYYSLNNEDKNLHEAKKGLKDALIIRTDIFNEEDYFENGPKLYFYTDYETFSKEYKNTVALEKYNEAFFEENDLVLFNIVHGSGSIGNFIDNHTFEDGLLIINLYYFQPDIGTCDMAYYNAFVPIPKGTEKFELRTKNIFVGFYSYYY